MAGVGIAESLTGREGCWCLEIGTGVFKRIVSTRIRGRALLTRADEHRAINLDHVAVIELEVFGIYRPPTRHPALPTTGPDDKTRIESALRALHDGRLRDCQVVCEDGRVIGCSSRVLEARWPWFKQRALTTSTPFTSTSIQISESYPIVKAFLEYMYTLDLVTVLQRRLPVLCGLLMLAKQYGVPHLEALVVHALHGRLDEASALGIYEVATLCECRPLQVRALKVVLVSRCGKENDKV